MIHHYRTPDGQVLTWTSNEPDQAPLDPIGALAALLAATGVLELTDAANAVGRQPKDLIAEAQAWAAAGGNP